MKLPNININKEKTCSIAFKFAFVLFAASIITQAFITNKFAIKGSEMVELQDRKEDIETQISALELEASQLSSLSFLEQKASELGFAKYNDALAVIGSGKLAAVR